jgi:hypothetical protein
MVLGVGVIAANFYWVTIAVRSQFPMAAFMPFVAVLLLNLALLLLLPKIALRQGELLTVFSMLWVVGTIPMWAQFWASITAAPSHFATVENRWAERFFDYLPWHVFAPPRVEVIMPFWFGLEEGSSVPWSAWIGVLAQWLGASLSMVVFGYCLLLLFQRQWERAEKLTFPLAQMPLDLTAGFHGKRRLPALFRSRLFWLGFGTVFVPMAYNVLTYFAPGLTAVDIYAMRYPLDLGELFGGVTVRLLPTVMAVTYLCPLDIMGSLLVFYMLAIIKKAILFRTGFSLPGMSSVGATGMLPEHQLMMNMESYGALLFVAFWSIYLARGHLRKVWRQVIAAEGEPHEVLRHRLALIGMVMSAIYLCAWAVGLGLSLPLAIGSLTLIWLTYFVTIKLIAATGFAYLFPVRTHLRGESFVVDLVGSAFLSPRSLTGFKVLTSNAFFGNFCMPAWPAITHHLRIFGGERQPIVAIAVVVVAFTVGYLVAFGTTVERAYDLGGELTLDRKATWVFDAMAFMMNNRTTAGASTWGLWGLGFVEAAGMAALRARFHWFPLHPIGLAFQDTFGTRLYWFSLLLVWICKFALLQFGGVRAYLKGKPFFYGLAVAYAVGVGLSMIVDRIWFAGSPHYVHGW